MGNTQKKSIKAFFTRRGSSELRPIDVVSEPLSELADDVQSESHPEVPEVQNGLLPTHPLLIHWRGGGLTYGSGSPSIPDSTICSTRCDESSGKLVTDLPKHPLLIVYNDGLPTLDSRSEVTGSPHTATGGGGSPPPVASGGGSPPILGSTSEVTGSPPTATGGGGSPPILGSTSEVTGSPPILGSTLEVTGSPPTATGGGGSPPPVASSPTKLVELICQKFSKHVFLSYQGRATVWIKEDLSRSMSFFGDIIDIYPSGFIELPDVRELDHNPMELIATIMALSENDQHPIPNAMMCVRVIRAADFLGADRALHVLRERLACEKRFLTNTTPVSKLREYIRNRYRMTGHLMKKMDGGKCMVCCQSLYQVFPSVTLVGKTIRTTCCSKMIHLKCYSDIPSCQVCGKNLGCLPCLFCGEDIKQAKDTFFETYEVQKKNRMPCCKANVCALCEVGAERCSCPCCGARIVGWMVAIKGQKVSFEQMEAKERENQLRRELNLNYDDPLPI